MNRENSNVHPPEYRTEKLTDGRARITLFDGVTDTGIDGGDRYTYNSYTIYRAWRDTLPQMIAARLADWLALAKSEDAPKAVEPTPDETLRADVDYLAMVTGVEL